MPRVFISYSHDSPEHESRVLKLVNRLRGDGIDCRFDQDLAVTPPAEGLLFWMQEQIVAADFVLVVCTEQYALKTHALNPSGVKLEISLIFQSVYESAMNNKKFIPTIFDPADARHIPIWLRQYLYDNPTDDHGYDKLHRRLLNSVDPPISSDAARVAVAAHASAETLENILERCNRAALSLYNQHVHRLPPSDAGDRFGRERYILAGGYWDDDDYEAQKNYIDLRRDNPPELILQTACRRLSESFASGDAKRIWLIGDAGTGKTTAMYRIYFHLLQKWDEARRTATPFPYPVPVLIQLRKVQAHYIEQLSAPARDPDFISNVFDIWLRRRQFEIPESARVRLHESFYDALTSGRIVLLVDSYDELGRIAVQRGIFRRLFELARYYIAASRPEFHHDYGPDVLRIRAKWDIPTIRLHLNQVFAKSKKVADALAMHIERSDNLPWLRNARYLHMLCAVVRRRLESGDETTEDILTSDEYALLSILYRNAVERLEAIPAAERRAGDVDTFENEIRRRLREIAFASIETGSLAVARQNFDDLWRTLAFHAGEVVKHREDYTSTESHFTLASSNWVDFFLVEILIRDLERPPSEPLSLQHLWSHTLITYAVEVITRKEMTRPLCRRIQDRLAHSRTLSSATGNGRRSRVDDVNLVQLLVRLLSSPAESVSRTPHITEENFSGLDLHSVDLHRMAFERCKFSHARLTDANLERAAFSECDFSGADLCAAHADHSSFIDCVFTLPGRSHDGGQSSVHKLSIQGASIKFDGTDQRPLFAGHGAIIDQWRYRSAFGKLFFAGQRQMLGSGLDSAERRYLSEIASALGIRGGARKQLVDLMAGVGNQRLVELIRSDPELVVLAVDRDGHDMDEIVEKVGQRFWMIQHEIDETTDLRALVKDFFDPPFADVVIGKKALHELPRHTQMHLLRSIAGVLREGGRLVLFTDSPYQMDDSGRDRLARLRERLVTYDEKDLEPLRAEFLDLSFDPVSRSDLAVFANLWVHLKDWANGNERELKNRYFSGAGEIIEWARAAGLSPVGQTYENRYRLMARRFNEAGYNKVVDRLEESNLQILPQDRSFYQDALHGTEKFQLFCDVVDRHLWHGGKPTRLGDALNAREQPLDLHKFHPALHAESIGLRYETGIEFDFTIHVHTFERDPSPQPPTSAP